MPTTPDRGRLLPLESQRRNSTGVVHTVDGLCTTSRHGDANAYNAGCRCPAARADATRRRTRHQLRVASGERPRVDATGTRRRVRALIANGWPRRILATELAITVTALDTYQRRQHVLASTATRVRDLYDRLADIPGPSDRARAQARAAGFLPPLWWDDDTIDDPAHTPAVREQSTKHDVDPVAVERACAGQPPMHLTVAERRLTVERLAARGNTDAQIANLLGATRDAIGQHRHRNGILAAAPSGREATVA